jgi:hypothetical protein
MRMSCKAKLEHQSGLKLGRSHIRWRGRCYEVLEIVKSRVDLGQDAGQPVMCFRS